METSHMGTHAAHSRRWLDNVRRVAGNVCTGRYIAHDHGARRDDPACAHGRALEHRRVVADPDIILDDDRTKSDRGPLTSMADRRERDRVRETCGRRGWVQV